MVRGFIVATPFIVRAISRNIMMPAISAGLGTAYGFARALGRSQQAYNRYLIGGASGAEYAVLRARQIFGVQTMSQRAGMNQNTALPPGPCMPDTGAKMMTQSARLSRLERRSSLNAHWFVFHRLHCPRHPVIGSAWFLRVGLGVHRDVSHLSPRLEKSLASNLTLTNVS
jgi:hypothetical protein